MQLSTMTNKRTTWEVRNGGLLHPVGGCEGNGLALARGVETKKSKIRKTNLECALESTLSLFRVSLHHRRPGWRIHGGVCHVCVQRLMVTEAGRRGGAFTALPPSMCFQGADGHGGGRRGGAFTALPPSASRG